MNIRTITFAIVVACAGLIDSRPVRAEDDSRDEIRNLAKVALTRTKLAQIKTYVIMFAIQHGHLPKSIVELKLDAEDSVDAWGGRLSYSVQDPTHFSIGSFGSDGRVGGSGSATDLIVVAELGEHSNRAPIP